MLALGTRMTRRRVHLQLNQPLQLAVPDRLRLRRRMDPLLNRATAIRLLVVRPQRMVSRPRRLTVSRRLRDTSNRATAIRLLAVRPPRTVSRPRLLTVSRRLRDTSNRATPIQPPVTSNRVTSRATPDLSSRAISSTATRTSRDTRSRGMRRSSTPSPAIRSSHTRSPARCPVSESDEKTWGIISHISIPFFGFIGPLIAYLVYKDRSAWLKDVTTEALNFSILYSIVYVISVILTAVVIGLILWPLSFIVALIFCIMGTIAANKHEFYKYPVNVRFIK